MSIWMQIGLGCIPVLLAMILLVCLTRKYIFSYVMGIVCVLVLGAGLVYIGLPTQQQQAKIQATQLPGQRETMTLAYELVSEGALEDAWDVLEEYSQLYGYDQESRLFSARTNTISGNYSSAMAIYNSLEQLQSEEAQLTETMLAAQLDDTAEPLPTEDLWESIFEAAEETYDLDIKDVEHLAEAVATVSGVEGVQSSFRDKDKLDAPYQSLYNLRTVANAKIKADVQEDNFDNIVEDLDGNATYDKVMIATELYISDLVKDNDFPDAYRELDRDMVRNLETAIKNVVRTQKNNLSSSEADEMEEKADDLLDILEDPLMAMLKGQLKDAAQKEAGGDRTKIYLELAKLAHHTNEPGKMDDYLKQSITSSYESDDDQYVKAMGQIISVIQGDNQDDLDKIKNMSQYVDAVLDHSLTVDVETIVNTAHEELPQEEPEETEETVEEQQDFSQAMVDYVSKAQSSISVGIIDVSEFNKVVARVQIATDDKVSVETLKNRLAVTDCGIEIPEFSLEKVEFKGANILLCCDTSGSMGNSIGSLRSAVASFVNQKTDEENIGIITFSSGINKSLPIGSSVDQLIQLAQGMKANGGTDIYGTTLSGLGRFPKNLDEHNILLVMTDGKDGGSASESTMASEISALADKNNVTVYTLGLGSDVNTSYLSTIAASGNGDFVYVSQAASLSSFYEMLHSQVKDQYDLTYHTKDTLTVNNRKLEVSIPNEGVKDSKYYNLEGAEGDRDIIGENMQVLMDLAVYGLDCTALDNNKEEATVHLTGNGFKPDYVSSITLDGERDFSLKMDYVDGNTYKIVLPADVAEDTYDLKITIDGRTCVLQDGLYIGKMGKYTTTYGPYTFLSGTKTLVGEDRYEVSGNVTLNGWLVFRGTVTLDGKPGAGNVVVTDNRGSYVRYDPNTAKGLAKFYADLGIIQNVPALGNFTLYADGMLGGSTLDDIYLSDLNVINALTLHGPIVHVEPKQLSLSFDDAVTKLPYLEAMLKPCDAQEKSPFKLEGAFTGIIGKSAVDIQAEVKYSDKADDFTQFNMMKAPVYLNLSKLSVEVDTLKDEYAIGAMVDVGLMDMAVGADFKWADGGVDEVTLHYDKSYKGTIGPVPVTYSDFSFGAQGIGSAVKSGKYGSITLEGGLSIATGKASDYFPKLKDFVGDLSLLELPNTTFQFRFSPLYLGAKAKMTFLSKVEIANAQVQLGNFKYTNSAVGLYGDVDTKGLEIVYNQGFDWKCNDNCAVKLMGGSTLSLHSRFAGFKQQGQAEVKVDWWFFGKTIHVDGETQMGIYTNGRGEKYFVLCARYQEKNGRTDGFYRYIDEKGHTGKQLATLT